MAAELTGSAGSRGRFGADLVGPSHLDPLLVAVTLKPARDAAKACDRPFRFDALHAQTMSVDRFEVVIAGEARHAHHAGDGRRFGRGD